MKTGSASTVGHHVSGKRSIDSDSDISLTPIFHSVSILAWLCARFARDWAVVIGVAAAPILGSSAASSGHVVSAHSSVIARAARDNSAGIVPMVVPRAWLLAQSPPLLVDTRAMQAACGPDHQVTLVQGQALFRLEWRVLGGYLLREVGRRVEVACPTQPVDIDEFAFTSDLPTEARQELMARGLPRWLRLLSVNPDTPIDGQLPSAPETRRAVGGGYIENVTQQTAGRRPGSGSAYYRIQPGPAADGTQPSAFIASCGSEDFFARGRICEAAYFLRVAGVTLRVRYSYWLPSRDRPDPRWPDDGDIMEPDGLLHRDALVRAFINQLVSHR